MRSLKIAGITIAAVAIGVSVTPSFARPHKPHKVCKIERHHGHPTKVCHWIR
jgi:methyl coenzyme M reductase subunit C-like uncharacterized protein (methanogenesis marker protein 7)